MRFSDFFASFDSLLWLLQMAAACSLAAAPPRKDGFQDRTLRDIVWCMSIMRGIILVGLAIVLIVAISSVCPLTPGGPGAIDFVQYWSAWQLMQRGENPYDAQLLAQIQSSLTGTSDFLIFSWNPPWTFVALSPVLSLPFSQSASLWLGIQVVLLLIISITAPRGLSTYVPRPLVCVLSTALFFPVLQSMKMGQLGILFAASISLFLFFQRTGAFLLAGLSLLPLTFKPHLFFLFVVPGILWVRQLPPRARTEFLLGSLGGFCLLVVTCCTLWPSGFMYWLQALTSKHSAQLGAQAVHISDWQTATIVTWIRLMVQQYTGALPAWPMLTIPLLSFIVCSLYLYRRCRPVRWETITPALLCLSLGTSNYGWVFDQSVLVVCQIALVSALSTLHDRTRIFACIFLLAGIQVLAIMGSNVFELPQQFYAWVPWMYLALLWMFSAPTSTLDREDSMAGSRSC